MARRLLTATLRRTPAWDTPELRSQIAGGVLLAAFLCVTFFFIPVPRAEVAFKLSRVMFLGATGILAALALRGGRATVARSAFGFMLGGHLAFVLLSQFAVHDPDGWTYVLLGTLNRPDGVMYQIFLAIFAWALYRTIATRREHRIFVRDVLIVICIVLALQSILVLLERFGHFEVVKSLWVYAYFPVASGTIGNSGMEAGLLLPGIGILLSLVTASRHRWSWLWAVPVLVLYAVAVSATANKSAVYAAIALAVVAVAMVRTWRSGLVALVVVACLALGSPLLPNRTATQASLDDLGSLQGRLIIWRTALDAIRHIPGEPLLGWGPDGFRIAQLRGVVSPRDLIPFHIRRTKSWSPSDRVESFKIVHKPGQPLRSAAIVYYVDTGGKQPVAFPYPVVVDRAHNYLLDRTLSYGGVDALIWIVLFLLPVVIGFTSKDWAFRGVAWGLASLVVYYQAWFPVLETEVFHVALIVIGWYFVGERWRSRRRTQVRSAPAPDAGSPP